ncbi:MAG TPA: hypothetical protein VLG50_08520, partial [Candidatus Saccharimonadales bacterium]|nr:hypothetical protein [Candidatus Saccharimonadales bacterium]
MKFKVLKLYLVLMTVMTTVTYADSCCNVSCNQSCNTSCCNNSCNSCCNNSCNSCCDSAVNVCGNLNNSAIDAIARANCCKPVCRDCETKCCQTACHRCCAISKNTWLPRSFVSYQTHNLFQNHYAYLDGSYDDEEHHINIASTFEYMQNFGAKCNSCCRNLGAMPFWSGTNTLTIGNNDGRANLDAYQLGLGNVVVDENGVAGVIQLNPEVQQAGADLSLYYVHSKECYGFYFRVNAPLASMRVKPNL